MTLTLCSQLFLYSHLFDNHSSELWRLFMVTPKSHYAVIELRTTVSKHLHATVYPKATLKSSGTYHRG